MVRQTQREGMGVMPRAASAAAVQLMSSGHMMVNCLGSSTPLQYQTFKAKEYDSHLVVVMVVTPA